VRDKSHKNLDGIPASILDDRVSGSNIEIKQVTTQIIANRAETGGEAIVQGKVHSYFTGDETNGWQLHTDVIIGEKIYTAGIYKYNNAQVSGKVIDYDVSQAGAYQDITIDYYKLTVSATVNILESDPGATEYQLIYDLGGGEPSIPSETGNSQFFTITMTEPVLEGYLFLGWSSVSGGAVQYTKGQTITVTAPVTTLYAVWVQDTEDPGASDKTNAPGIAKNADKTSAAAGETVHFTLTSNVPDFLGSYLPLTQPDDPTVYSKGQQSPASDIVRGSYPITFTDTYDPAIVFEAASSNITVTVNGNQVSPGLYTLTEGTGSFSVSMDLVELYEAAFFTESEISSAPAIIIEYDAAMSSAVKAGSYLNRAQAAYLDNTGAAVNSAEASVGINVYGIKVFKYDQSGDNKPLAGAEFSVTFGEMTIAGTTNESGYCTFDGLAAGEYTIRETKAPKDYKKSDTPLTVSIPGDPAAPVVGADNYAEVRFANSLIPLTGGGGTAMLYIAGSLLLVFGLVSFSLIKMNKRKAKHH
jgi:fimbrial isopeptide formation D2 family protein